jgi:hypothetical protein
LFGLLFNYEYRRDVSPKRLFSFTELQGVVLNKVDISITTDVEPKSLQLQFSIHGIPVSMVTEKSTDWQTFNFETSF